MKTSLRSISFCGQSRNFWGLGGRAGRFVLRCLGRVRGSACWPIRDGDPARRGGKVRVVSQLFVSWRGQRLPLGMWVPVFSFAVHRRSWSGVVLSCRHLLQCGRLRESIFSTSKYLRKSFLIPRCRLRSRGLWRPRRRRGRWGMCLSVKFGKGILLSSAPGHHEGFGGGSGTLDELLFRLYSLCRNSFACEPIRTRSPTFFTPISLSTVWSMSIKFSPVILFATKSCQHNPFGTLTVQSMLYL